MFATDEMMRRDPALSQHLQTEGDAATLWFKDADHPEIEFPVGIENVVGELLYGLVCAIDPDLIIETGTRIGISTRYMALALESNGHGRIRTCERDPYTHGIAVEKFKLTGLDKWIEPESRSSLGWQPSAIETVDLLFLDSEPTYRFQEMTGFLNLCKPGAIIAIHDLWRLYNPLFMDTPEAEEAYRHVLGLVNLGVLQVMHLRVQNGLTLFQYKGRMER